MSRTAARKQHTETLYIAFELGWTEWKLGFTRSLGQEPKLRSIAARNLGRLSEEISRVEKRWRLPARCRVVSCYEAVGSLVPQSYGSSLPPRRLTIGRWAGETQGGRCPGYS